MKRSTVVIALALVAVAGYIVFSSMGVATVSCEVCMDFKGREACRSARGPSQEDAIVTARDNACAQIVSGRTENILCGGTEPKTISCSN